MKFVDIPRRFSACSAITASPPQPVSIWDDGSWYPPPHWYFVMMGPITQTPPLPLPQPLPIDIWEDGMSPMEYFSNEI